jgi:hypothetical protein
MSEAATSTQVKLARLVVIALAVLTVLGLVMYGFSAEVHNRIWKDIADRPGGPMTFRFILQPCMAAIAALVDGIKDARTGRDPYLWTILSNTHKSAGRMREGIIATARIILLGLGMDAIYQATVLKTFYPGEMVIVALLLAFIPYVLLRGPFKRLAGWWIARKPPRAPSEPMDRT